MLCGEHGRGGQQRDDYLYVIMNMHWESHNFELPAIPDGRRWHVSINTMMDSPHDIYMPGLEILLSEQRGFVVGERSVVALVGR